jgi:hypothetical protein
VVFAGCSDNNQQSKTTYIFHLIKIFKVPT